MAYRTIHQYGSPRRVEGIALTATIYPGHLVELTNAAADTYKLFATATNTGENAVAVEDDMQGNPITTAYAISNRIQVNIYKSGEESLVRVAQGQEIAKGDKLIRAANGEVQKAEGDSSTVTQQVIGIALEAKSMDDSSSDQSDPLIRMRWL